MYFTLWAWARGMLCSFILSPHQGERGITLPSVDHRLQAEVAKWRQAWQEEKVHLPRWLALERRYVSCEILCIASQARCEDLAAELASKEKEEEREEEEEEHSREVEELRGEVFALNAKVRV